MKHLKPNFKNKVKVTLVSCCIAFMTFTSCSTNDDDALDCANLTWTQSVQTELNAWLTAAQVYASDSTSANCENYKTAGQAYLKALEEAKNCVPSLSLADFETALQEAKDELNEISC